MPSTKLVMRVSKIYLPNILGLLAEAQCACPFSELRFWCPLVAGSCLRWKTTVSWHLPPLCRNTTASLCVARWATFVETILLLYYDFCVISSTDDNGYYEPNATYRSTVRVIEQIRHDHVGEPVITVGQQKHLGTTLPDPSQEHG